MNEGAGKLTAPKVLYPPLDIVMARCSRSRISRVSTMCLGILIFLTGCEGFKVLTLHNVSWSNARVTIKPGIGLFDNSNIANFPDINYADSVTRILEPDESMVLLSIFTYTMFNTKLKPHELRINYLRVETDKQVIEARSKEAILALLHDKRTKYTRRDKHRSLTNASNFANIFIRE